MHIYSIESYVNNTFNKRYCNKENIWYYLHLWVLNHM